MSDRDERLIRAVAALRKEGGHKAVEDDFDGDGTGGDWYFDVANQVEAMLAEHAALRAERDKLLSALNEMSPSLLNTPKRNAAGESVLPIEKAIALAAGDMQALAIRDDAVTHALYQGAFVNDERDAPNLIAGLLQDHARLAALEEALTALGKRWEDIGAHECDDMANMQSGSAFYQCADELAALRARLTPEPKS